MGNVVHVGQSDETQELSNDVIRSENKTIFMDLRANNRGKFLKISTVMQSIRPGPGQRDTVVIPGAGFQVMLNLVNEVCPPEQCEGAAPLPGSRSVSTGGKIFHLDVRRNMRGVFMTITESTQGGRQAITVPQSAWGRLASALGEIDDEFQRTEGARLGGFGAAGAAGGAGGFGAAAEAPVDPEARQLWVENIPWDANEDQLRMIFQQCGEFPRECAERAGAVGREGGMGGGGGGEVRARQFGCLCLHSMCLSSLHQFLHRLPDCVYPKWF